jgi:hypothetical protein
MPQNIAAAQISIADWVTGLAAIPQKDFTLKTVQDYVIHHPVQPASLEPYIFFSKGSYTCPVREVMNLAEFNQRAVSIHIYSKPFDSCEVYYRDKNKYADVPLFYTSEYSKLNPGEKLV